MRYTVKAYKKVIDKAKKISKGLGIKMECQSMTTPLHSNITPELPMQYWTKVILYIKNTKQLRKIDLMLDHLGLMGIGFSVMYSRNSAILYLESTFRSSMTTQAREKWKASRLESLMFLNGQSHEINGGDYCVETIKCSFCSHKWVACFSELCETLECPNCNNFNHI